MMKRKIEKVDDELRKEIKAIKADVEELKRNAKTELLFNVEDYVKRKDLEVELLKTVKTLFINDPEFQRKLKEILAPLNLELSTTTKKTSKGAKGESQN